MAHEPLCDLTPARPSSQLPATLALTLQAPASFLEPVELILPLATAFLVPLVQDILPSLGFFSLKYGSDVPFLKQISLHANQSSMRTHTLIHFLSHQLALLTPKHMSLSKIILFTHLSMVTSVRTMACLLCSSPRIIPGTH